MPSVQSIVQESRETRRRIDSAAAREVVVQPEPRGVGSGGGVVAAYVKSVSYDHVVVRLKAGDSEGDTDVIVAKAPELRKTGFEPNLTGDGKTYTYTSGTARSVTPPQAGSTPESQVIVPAFRLPSGEYKGSLVYIMRVPGGTGVTVDGAPAVWQDLNVDGRAWAKM